MFTSRSFGRLDCCTVVSETEDRRSQEAQCLSEFVVELFGYRCAGVLIRTDFFWDSRGSLDFYYRNRNRGAKFTESVPVAVKVGTSSGLFAEKYGCKVKVSAVLWSVF